MAKTPTSNIEKALSGGGINEIPLDMNQFIQMADKEKIEFLGDRVLGFIISKKLIDIYPDENEGSLDKKFASLVIKTDV